MYKGEGIKGSFGYLQCKSRTLLDKAVFFQLLFVLYLNFSMHCIFLFFMQKNLFEMRTLKVSPQNGEGRGKRGG